MSDARPRRSVDDPMASEETSRLDLDIAQLAFERPELSVMEVTDLYMRARRSLLLAGEAPLWPKIWAWVAAAAPMSPDFRQIAITMGSQVPPAQPTHRGRRTVQERADEIRTRYRAAVAAVRNDGKPLTDELIAEKLEVTTQTIYRWRKRLGTLE